MFIFAILLINSGIHLGWDRVVDMITTKLFNKSDIVLNGMYTCTTEYDNGEKDTTYWDFIDKDTVKVEDVFSINVETVEYELSKEKKENYFIIKDSDDTYKYPVVKYDEDKIWIKASDSMIKLEKMTEQEIKDLHGKAEQVFISGIYMGEIELDNEEIVMCYEFSHDQVRVYNVLDIDNIITYSYFMGYGTEDLILILYQDENIIAFKVKNFTEEHFYLEGKDGIMELTKIEE